MTVRLKLSIHSNIIRKCGSSRALFFLSTKKLRLTLVFHHADGSRATMIAGPEGCVVLVFPRSTFVPFLDANPGMLLCLLGTQVVV